MRLWLTMLCTLCVLSFGAWAQDTGPVTIGGVQYGTIDPGEPFEERPLPEQDWEPPSPTAAEQTAGMMAYVTPDPGDYKPARLPKPQERVDHLSTFMTPGEDEPVAFGVHALADLAGLWVTVDPGDAPVTVDIRHEHFWPQRTGWRSREWYMTPELLLPCSAGKKMIPTQRGVLQEVAFDVAAGETAAFWLTLTAAAEARPGIYEATVRVGASGREALVLPLRVEVLPFSLQRPDDKFWLLYCDQGRWNTMSDAQVEAELRDFSRHGITGLVEMRLGSPDISGIAEGKVSFDAGPYRKLSAQCEAAGLPGPHVCSFGGWPQRVREALNLDVDLAKDTWPRELCEGVEAVARAAVEATADAPQKWYFYGVDEPSGDNTYAIQEYQCWRRGGAETYATFYNLGFLEKAAEFLTAPCFVVGLVSSEGTAEAAREACEETGAEFWWYGTGSYVNPFPQEGYMFHNRYGAGYLFWKTGARASVAWTFCRPHEDVFNDFDGSKVNPGEPKEQNTVYPHLLRPDDWSTYQGAIPTLAWESMREGVDDYRYMHTLTTLIARAEASESAAVKAEGARARQMLDDLVEAIPWANPMGGVAFETVRMQQVRRALADLIVGLQASLDGRALSAPTRPVADFTLRLSTVAPRLAEEALPVIPVMPTPIAPDIDGRLDDISWSGAAVADGFTYAHNGQRAAVPTEARILCDENALYVAFDCAEPAMDKLVAKQTGRDTDMVWLDDGIEFFVAGADRSRYAHVIVNTNGSVYDEAGQDPSWNAKLQVGVDKRADGWSVELAIPWTDLAAAGVERSAAMSVNFCRSRFAVAGVHPHTAWSCPYGGFHTPDRFGTALLQVGPIALAGLHVPTLWGRQNVQLSLRNLTGKSTTALVRLRGRSGESVRIAPGATAEVSLPVNLQRAGKQTLTLSWGPEGGKMQETRLLVKVPKPLELAASGGFATAGSTVDMPVVVNAVPSRGEDYRVWAELATAQGSRTVSLPAQAGEQSRVALSTGDRVGVSIWLVNAAGEPLAPALETSLFALSG